MQTNVGQTKSMLNLKIRIRGKTKGVKKAQREPLLQILIFFVVWSFYGLTELHNNLYYLYVGGKADFQEKLTSYLYYFLKMGKYRIIQIIV